MRGKKGIEGGTWLWIVAAAVALLVLFIALIASGRMGGIINSILGIGKNATDTAQNCITNPNSPDCIYSQSPGTQTQGDTGSSSTTPASTTPTTNKPSGSGILGGVKTG